MADTIRNNESETKTFWGEGYIYEKLIFKNSQDILGTTDTENNQISA
jgi:hypothetical protein